MLNLAFNLAISLSLARARARARDPVISRRSGVRCLPQRRAKRLKSSMCNACFCATVRAFLIREATTKPSATTARLYKRRRRRRRRSSEWRRLVEGLLGSIVSHDRVFRSVGSVLIGRQHPRTADPPLIMTAIRYRLRCRSRACEIQKSQ